MAATATRREALIATGEWLEVQSPYTSELVADFYLIVLENGRRSRSGRAVYVMWLPLPR